MDVSENSGTPQIIQFNRVFHYFHHPFWGKHLYFWISTHMAISSILPSGTPQKEKMIGALTRGIRGWSQVNDGDPGGLESYSGYRMQWEDILISPIYTLQGTNPYPTLGSSENHLQNAMFGGYVSSLEGISPLKFQWLWGSDYITAVDVMVWVLTPLYLHLQNWSNWWTCKSNPHRQNS